MYQAFYGLSSKPFQLNPDPDFYFGSTQHRRARAYLEYGVHRNEGFIVITGEVGAGKTTIVRALLAGLDAHKVVAANLVTTQLDADDTLRLVGAAFGVRVKDQTKAELLMGLEAWLVSQTSQGKRCLLVVDEAQNLTPRAVEELRMLSNFQYGQQALLQTFLVGQPEFRAILQSPAMQQLAQRVAATCHIGPLDATETEGYIAHRLHCAGSTGRPHFADAALAAIHKASGGIPRRINLICDRLLLAGFLANKDSFSEADVQEVVAEMCNEGRAPAAPSGAAAAPDYGTAASLAAPQSAALLLASAEQHQALEQHIHNLGVAQHDSRLRRLEASMLRLERLNLQLLALLQKLLASVRTEERP